MTTIDINNTIKSPKEKYHQFQSLNCRKIVSEINQEMKHDKRHLIEQNMWKKNYRSPKINSNDSCTNHNITQGKIANSSKSTSWGDQY